MIEIQNGRVHWTRPFFYWSARETVWTTIAYPHTWKGDNSVIRVSLVVAVALLCTAGCGRSKETTTASVDALELALKRREYRKARDLVGQLLILDPKDGELLEHAGDIEAKLNNAADSVEYFVAAIEHQPSPSAELFDKTGRQWMALGRPFESVGVLRSAVEKHPDVASIRRDLGGLQASLGLERQAADQLRWLVRHGQADVGVLIMLSDLNRPQTDEATCNYALKAFGGDLRPQFSLARLKAYHSDWEGVFKQLSPVVKHHPGFNVAQAYYGRSLAETGRSDQFRKWDSEVGKAVNKEPQYWLAVGVAAENQGNLEQASRAFWNAVILDEDNGESLGRLAASLAQLGRTDDAKIAGARAGAIGELRGAVESFFSRRNNSQVVAVEIAECLEELGRRWEALAWVRAANGMNQDKVADLAARFKEMNSKLNRDTPWQVAENEIKHQLKHLGELTDSGGPSVEIEPASESNLPVRFVDRAADRNLKHECLIGSVAGDEAGLWIYQTGSGGIAVIDYDLDGLPDLDLTVSNGKPRASDSDPNRLYRNLGERFDDVTDLARTGDTGLSQGLAVGDFNADGFQDLMVANVGRNRLYRNNGDGTFTDVTEAVGLRGDTWTTSVGIADIDQDGHADLFEVGYCANEALEVPCVDEKIGKPRSCMPMSFPAMGDRVWRGTGDGRFSDATSAWLGDHRPGRGFGLLVGRFDEKPGIDLVVANDMSANHFWSTRTDGGFSLVEQGVVCGLAFDARSLSQASMGITAADADGDGDIDFYATHFTGEYNTFYEQVRPGTWVDVTGAVGLDRPTRNMLGYGTKWLDANNDGSLELIVANGNIDDFSHNDKQYRMPMQMFRTVSNRRWEEIRAAELGEFFAEKRLCRSLATVDVNRDGRTDVVVTQLFKPVALLINESDVDGPQLTLRLVATSGERDPIGANVHATIGGRQSVVQLIAGDGYQCSSERCVRFGLGKAGKAESVTIHWPNGESENVGSIDGGGDFLVVQGSGEAFPLSSPR